MCSAGRMARRSGRGSQLLRKGDPFLPHLARMTPSALAELSGMTLAEAVETQAAIYFHRFGVGEAQVAQAVSKVVDLLNAKAVSRKIVGDEVQEFIDDDLRLQLEAAREILEWGRSMGLLPVETSKALGGAGHVTIEIRPGLDATVKTTEPRGVDPGARVVG